MPNKVLKKCFLALLIAVLAIGCAQTGSLTSGDGTLNWLSTVGNDCDDTDPTKWQGCSQ